MQLLFSSTLGLLFIPWIIREKYSVLEGRLTTLQERWTLVHGAGISRMQLRLVMWQTKFAYELAGGWESLPAVTHSAPIFQTVCTILYLPNL